MHLPRCFCFRLSLQIRGSLHPGFGISSAYRHPVRAPLLFKTCQVPVTELRLGVLPDPDDLNGRDRGLYRRVVVSGAGGRDHSTHVAPRTLHTASLPARRAWCAWIRNIIGDTVAAYINRVIRIGNWLTTLGK